MTEMCTLPATQPVTDPGMSDPTAAALARCRAACLQAKQAYAKVHGPKTIASYEAEKAGREAYRNNMPALSSRDNIRAFIACVVEGLLIDAIREKASGHLLYAAQVALAGLPREAAKPLANTTAHANRKVGRPRKTAKPPAPQPQPEAAS